MRKADLERLYRRYNDARYLASDPVGFVHRYRDPLDREVAGLVASSLAFGKVTQIRGSVGRVLDALGPSPAAFLRGALPRDVAYALRGLKHRWIEGSDLAGMLIGARAAMLRYGSLGGLFRAGLGDGDEDVCGAVDRFVAAVADGGPGFKSCLLPSPRAGSACKRVHLFLRWMVRADAIDLGVWEGVPAAKLVVPLDTHMFRVARRLGFTKRRAADLRAAREATSGFRRLSPEDPVRYDFALTRAGILGIREEEATGADAGDIGGGGRRAAPCR